MVKHYNDHAANERTFLAWVRTSIAVMAFGFVIERFDLFLKYAAPAAAQLQIAPHGGVFADLAGLAFIVLVHSSTEHSIECSLQCLSQGEWRIEAGSSCYSLFAIRHSLTFPPKSRYIVRSHPWASLSCGRRAAGSRRHRSGSCRSRAFPPLRARLCRGTWP